MGRLKKKRIMMFRKVVIGDVEIEEHLEMIKKRTNLVDFQPKLCKYYLI